MIFFATRPRRQEAAGAGILIMYDYIDTIDLVTILAAGVVVFAVSIALSPREERQ